VEVIVRLDFLALSAAEETKAVRSSRGKDHGSRLALPDINIPRETAVSVAESQPPEPQSEIANRQSPIAKSAAGIPSNYVADPRQRVEVYRKLAEATDDESLERLKAELRDRFGPLPPPVELLLQVAGLKLAAHARGIATLETKGDKLMLTRHGDFVMVDGKFPRLTKTTARGRLGEIKRLLQAL
jgi:transcription-repair coupling factor (superfamily II helicase)